mmetsp:Transcript_12469/g.24896  ORF Transcript_12469/g.24896 Transcript_12469/m.24896 type:complete len:92 (-) Transcript_12469:33-308(-)
MAKRDADWLFDCCASGDVAGDECRLGGGGGNRCCKGERGLDMMMMPKMEMSKKEFLFLAMHSHNTSSHSTTLTLPAFIYLSELLLNIHSLI